MKIKVWDESCKQDKDAEFFYLRLYDDEGIDLHFCDKNGKILESSHVLKICNFHKCIVMMPALDDKFPLKLDFLNIPIAINAIEANKKLHSFLENKMKNFSIESIKENSANKNKSSTH